MATDFLTPIQVGAGIVARGQQMRAQKQQMEQENTLFPLKILEIERGLKAKALEIEQAQWKQEVFLQNKAGLVEGWKMAAEPGFFENPVVARSKLAGLHTRFPYLSADPAFQELIKGVESAEFGARVKTQADATIERAKISAASRIAAIGGVDGQDKDYGEILQKEIIPGSKIYAVYRKGSPGLHIVDINGKEKELSIAQMSSAARNLILMKRELETADQTDPNYQKQVDFVNALEEKLRTQNTSPKAATPPPLNSEPLRWNPNTGWNR